MRKKHWITIIILLVLAILIVAFYQNIRRLWLPAGTPAERPLG